MQDTKLSNYFKLYTRFLMGNKYIVVAHRNYLSVFDQSNKHGEGSWLKEHFKVGNG